MLPIDLGCIRFTITNKNNGINAALNIKGMGDVMSTDVVCGGPLCYLNMAKMGNFPVYLGYTDPTNGIIVLKYCVQDLV